MSEKNLVVCDRDKRYARGLGENICERRDLSLHVFVCSSVESALRFAESRTIDILLIDGEIPPDERCRLPAQQVFVLTGREEPALAEAETSVSKYQCVDAILGVVFQTYYEKTNHTILKQAKKPRQRILAVYSPIHRAGKTTFALALGRELAKRERVLYLNMECYPDIDSRFVRAEGKNLGDLLYYMRQEEPDMAMRIASMVFHREELEYVPPMLNMQDLQEVSFDEWSQLMQTILQKTGYETLILDLDDGIQGLFSILDACDEIYMPVLGDEISQKKLAQYESHIRQRHLAEVLQKTHCFVADEDMEACGAKWGKEEL